jgi:hypothetical protein
LLDLLPGLALLTMNLPVRNRTLTALDTARRST